MVIPYELLTNQSNSSDIPIFPSNWHINRHGKIHAAHGSQRETIMDFHTCCMFNLKPAIIICGFHSFEVFSTNKRYSDLNMAMRHNYGDFTAKIAHLFQSSPIPWRLGFLTSTLRRGRHFVTKLTSRLRSNTTMSIVYIYIYITYDGDTLKFHENLEVHPTVPVGSDGETCGLTWTHQRIMTGSVLCFRPMSMTGQWYDGGRNCGTDHIIQFWGSFGHFSAET